MLSVLSLMSKIVFFPVWALWRAYLLLWWAFDTRPAPAPAAAQPGVQDSAFQVTSSSPEPLPLPRGALRGGFVGTWLVSIALGGLCAALADQHVIEPGRSAIAWGWGSALTTVASLLAVRAVVSRPRAKVSRVQRAKEGIKAAAVSVAPKAAQASVKVAATACKLGAAGCRGIAGAMERAAPVASRFGTKFREAMRRAGGPEPAPESPAASQSAPSSGPASA